METKLKSLANCTPREFLVQTNKIRKSVENWITMTQIREIRKRVPVLIDTPALSANVTEKEMADYNAVVEKNKKAISEQSYKNIMAILEAALEVNLDATLEIMCHICFLDPKCADDYEMADLFDGLNESMTNPSVVRFFSSLASLVLTGTSAVAKV